MADSNVPTGAGPGNPDLFAKLSGLIDLHLRVQPDHDLGVVEVLFTNVPDRCSLTLTDNAALELSLHLIAASARLRGMGGQP